MDDGNAGTNANGYRAYRIDVYDNTIANNISTHEGGGVAVDDATNVHLVSNTIVRNITTATAATSNGQPAPTGVSLAQNSALLMCRGVPLQANGTCKLPNGVQQVAAHTPPELFDDIFWDNRAGAYGPAGVAGIGLTGDTHPVHLWDVGYADDPTYALTMTSSIFDASCTVTTGAGGCFVDPAETVVSSPTNHTTADPLTANPGFVDPSYKVSIRILPWRNQPRFIGAVMVAADNPIDVDGDYHLAGGSPAIDAGQPWTAATPEPCGGRVAPHDIDDQARPSGARYDIGSDEK